MAADPKELKNLAGDAAHAEILAMLRVRCNEYREQLRYDASDDSISQGYDQALCEWTGISITAWDRRCLPRIGIGENAAARLESCEIILNAVRPET